MEGNLSMVPEILEEAGVNGGHDTAVALTVALVAIVAGLVLLLVVKLIQMVVSKRYVRVAQLNGIADEEMKDRVLSKEKEELQQKIKAHESAIQGYERMKKTIRFFSQSA